MEKKVLCFTPSFTRLKMTRSCILDITNQSYQNIFHSVNITLEQTDNKETNILKILEDVKTDKNSFNALDPSPFPRLFSSVIIADIKIKFGFTLEGSPR